MPVTEIVIPCLKQDESTRSKYLETIQPFVKMISLAPGARGQFVAPILTENGLNVQSDVKYALGLEWENAQNIYDFLAGPEFQSHGAHVLPLFTAPPQLQIYRTDLSPVAAFSSRLTEVFRIKIGDGGSEFDVVRANWSNFVAAIERSLHKLPSLSGTSLNLHQQLFLGVIGWEGIDVRENIIGEEVVKELKSKLESLKEMDSFTVSFAAP